ncbi:MAG: Bug family tripartite tricarboxylate transporter substrate binding protein [Pseudomonadota bacterium]|jgi:tripartite-type tricarboxylate transporter receptor subunit TctC
MPATEAPAAPRTLPIAWFATTALVLASTTGLAVRGIAPAQAQAWPVKPVRVIVAFPPGGISDFATRALAPGLQEALRQSIVIENRGGASGMVGAEVVAKSAPDGYTLLAHTVSFSVAPHLQSRINVDPLRDFAPVTQVIDAPNLLVVTNALPVRSVKELTALAQRRRGELTYASSGQGSGTHLSGELYKVIAGVDIVHVAYKGGGPAVADLLGGHVPMMFSTLPSVLPHVRSGRLRALAVTGDRRFPGLESIPTMAEAGATGYSFSGWAGLFAPAGTPREVVARISEESARVLRAPGIREKLLAQGADPVGSTPEEFAAFFRNELTRWGRLVEQARIKPE